MLLLRLSFALRNFQYVSKLKNCKLCNLLQEHHIIKTRRFPKVTSLYKQIIADHKVNVIKNTRRIRKHSEFSMKQHTAKLFRILGEIFFTLLYYQEEKLRTIWELLYSALKRIKYVYVVVKIL